MSFGHEHNGEAGSHHGHHGPRPLPATLAAPEIVSAWRTRMLIVAVVATILTVPFVFTHEGRNHILRAYLMGYMTCFGFAGGGLVLLMLQYGTGGKMQGRKFMISATWNAPKDTFDNPSSVLYGGKGTADLFLPITSNYKFCGYDILPAFGVFDIFKHPDIPHALEDYKRHLEKHSL